jgi:hypothetical protein
MKAEVPDSQLLSGVWRALGMVSYGEEKAPQISLPVVMSAGYPS